MTLITDIEGELKDARRARDDARRDALALLLNALRSAEKELQRPLSEDESLQVLQRERKKRVEAMEAFDAAGREEQADREEFELDVIEEFMPDQLTEEELEEIVDDVIAEVGATSHPRPRAGDGRRDAARLRAGRRIGRQPDRAREARLSDLVRWTRALQALAQTGLTYAEGPYDRERYEAVQRIAAEMAAAAGGEEPAELLARFAEESGYRTPKVDVRGVVLDVERLLLVREPEKRRLVPARRLGRRRRDPVARGREGGRRGGRRHGTSRAPARCLRPGLPRPSALAGARVQAVRPLRAARRDTGGRRRRDRGGRVLSTRRPPCTLREDPVGAAHARTRRRTRSERAGGARLAASRGRAPAQAGDS